MKYLQRFPGISDIVQQTLSNVQTRGCYGHRTIRLQRMPMLEMRGDIHPLPRFLNYFKLNESKDNFVGYIQIKMLSSDWKVVYGKRAIPVAARLMTCVCGRLHAGIVGLNPAGGHGCLLWVSCGVRQRSLRRAYQSSRGNLPSVVRLSVIEKPRNEEAPAVPRLLHPGRKSLGGGAAVEASWNVMAHAQKPDFVFRRNGRVHLNRRGTSV